MPTTPNTDAARVAGQCKGGHQQGCPSCGKGNGEHSADCWRITEVAQTPCDTCLITDQGITRRLSFQIRVF